MLVIPPDLTFTALALEVADNGALYFLPPPLIALAEANGIDLDPTDENAACALIADLYLAHVEVGGAPDPAIEAVLARLDKPGR